MMFDCQGFTGEINVLGDVFCALARLIDEAYLILLSVAILVLAYGIFKFIAKAGDQAERAKGRAFIFWGVIGIFLMTSVWGLVNILVNSFEMNTDIYVPGDTIVPGYIPPPGS